ncbi:MAG TPA: HAMP domain-containing sensor histidine kinase [Candidatus Limnocylindrales bacterium]|nr:HAMP domain-containing sensor histidine kinase [Candidatus Limnocylindrales bacterium]
MPRLSVLIGLAVLPTVLLSAIGILLLIFQRAAFDIVFGILILIFSVAVLTGAFILHGLGRRQLQTAKLQTDFVAKVSHELRTPLASIRMFVDTLRQGGLEPDDVERCLDTLSAETSRLSSLIERLLSWGRMESGRRRYELLPESVGPLVAEAVAQVEAQIPKDRVLELDLPSSSPVVRADRKALVEALLNLLSNAFKYGATRVVVTVRRRKGRVAIEVADNGPGVPREEQRRVFEKFYRGKEHIRSTIEGSGLGLAMARLTVQAHDGKLSLHSDPGHGSRFVVSLPMVAPTDAALEVPPE